ncbi:3-oxoacyl-[acyl-carrier-protein] synthase III C-terminal domain-containing protein [Streptomyces sp. SL13]|uniref:3-oxoacyl-[acyl-carrier-protein] synthase III C-terminal domain-containing protein n=1 Tax=Streptantibioticus silvisoli TaxID=2705255 RepID=A0AA90H2N1_9ACTN|nr:3-oxoacyl-[acyl-carrier-protein] synthase III C-terminal domain-containing protein [Streptantibioticus silvisoli]MDI5970926.1 3-oxoacyl-[acyl-carrier-protein] synthase III C-terminal domain-containing protein [Streptantibioticus silvisoli]
MSAGLSKVAVRLPGRVESVDDILARQGCGPRERRVFTTLHGLRHSPTLAAGERTEDLLVQAGRAALGGRSAALVLYGHTLQLADPEMCGAFRDRLRDRLGLPGSGFYGVSHINCTSVLRSLELARRYLARPGAGPDERVLVLGGDQGSHHDRSRVIPGLTVAGDAVVAVLVQGPGGTDRPRYRYLGGAVARDARFHRNLRMTRQESAAFAGAAGAATVETVRRAAHAAGVDLDQIDWVMPHLANRTLWRGFSRLSGFAWNRICLDLIPERGHNFGTDALMALEHADRTRRVRPGDRCALVSVGQGAYFQTVIVEVVDDE